VRITGDLDRSSLERSVVTIGVFDGLHRGHQCLVEELRRLADEFDAVPTVVTFDIHPASVVVPTKAPRLISTLSQRLEGLAALGVAHTTVVTFDAKAATETASDFVRRVLVNDLRVAAVLVGDDTHFGRNRSGDAALLRRLGSEMGFDVVEAPTYGNPERFSSTAVRTALVDGNLEAASEVLGHPFILRGTVVHGDHRGREIGYPTANLLLAETQLLPRLGIYAAAVWAKGQWRAGAVSVGQRPQFYDEGVVLVEVHLPGFGGDLYNETLDVAFLQRLRAEAKFDSLEALLRQMATDVADSQFIFGNFSPEGPFLLR
jgi:riboflavin kinase/FMN adenylyltransferase